MTASSRQPDLSSSWGLQPIRGEYWGHVTCCPPTAVHLRPTWLGFGTRKRKTMSPTQAITRAGYMKLRVQSWYRLSTLSRTLLGQLAFESSEKYC